jgi:type I restriction enzyme S subunit
VSTNNAYEEYTDTGVPWLGRIPKHWDVVQSRRLFAQRKERMRPDDEQLTASQKYGVIPQRDFMRLEEQSVMQVFTGADILKHVEPGDFVISMRSFQGGLEFCAFAGCVSSAYVGIFPIKGVVPRFFKHLFKCKPYIQALQSTSNLVRDGQALRFQNFAQVPLPLVSLEEQTQIAKFLDYETAKIDALIEKQQQLIALLNEKRQAVISHAVTKGLNPNAPMRDSGIEWLGQVPAHWTVCQLKFNTLEMQTGPFGSQLHAEDYVEGGIPLVNPAHMVSGTVVPESGCTVDSATCERLSRHKLSVGDLVLARRGELGRCVVIGENEAGWLCGTGSLRATLSTRLDPYYAYMLLSSEGVKSELSLESRGSTMENLNTTTLGKIRIPIPPRTEQENILRYVGHIASRYDAIERAALDQSRLLQERRTALISAAVTGKIDVRGWKPPAINQNPAEAQA